MGDVTESLFPFVFPAGSFVIERYVYTRVNSGKPGVQWCVQRVEKDGSLTQLIVCPTRREAAEWIAHV